MKILMALTYYRPHVSGLTIYVQRLAESLAAQGHEVTVLTSRYNSELPPEEEVNGIRIVRVPVLTRVSKGVVMPGFAAHAIRLLREHDVVSVHLPQFEASILAWLGRFVVRRPVVLTYHCDLLLPPGLFNRLVDQVIFVSNYLAGLWADAIVAYTEDYAVHSRFLSKFPQKRHVIPPPVHVPIPEPAAVRSFAGAHRLDGKPVVGFAARFATEKGVEYMLGAIPYILRQMPDVRVLFAGEYKNVVGEDTYRKRLQPLLERYKDHWTFLGVLDPREMASFYAACDVTVLPSINSTESFGLVQVESMLCGTPVCASNLPGVRMPVRTTGMGEVVPIRDSAALAAAIVKVMQHPEAYRRSREEVAGHFSTERTRDEYVRLFTRLLVEQHRSIIPAEEGKASD
ncbi:MAG: glycosyltransferase family 4 protein [Dehalococcoidales bacterium]|nr:glycosyltransferase family 4 protein [Dehalococcoidales bacterium]